MTTDPAQRRNLDLFNPGETSKGIAAIVESGRVFEIRALDARLGGQSYPRTVSGYFDNAKSAVDALSQVTSATGIYLTLNPVVPDLLARCKNRLKAAKSGEATGDIHIVCRHWLLIDIDPFRPKGISSTDDEKKQAAILARDIRDYLRGLGWPEPVVADSGNGWHLLYRVALPSNDGGRVQRVLRALSSRFDNDHCKVDKGVFNPSRIVKLYGTLARKGDSLPDRPHRLSRIRSIPVPITTVSQSQLDAFVASHPVTSTPAASTPTSPGRNGQFSLADFLTKHSIAVSGKKPLADGRTAHLLAQCPFDENHGDHGEVAVFESLGGKLGFQCKHNGCEGRGWRDFRKHYEPEYCIDAEWSGGQHEVTVRTLDQFTANEGEASKTLAGKRWLCRGGSVLWCGPTGIGKSSSVMQAAIEWALGRPFFDINPVGNLQVLIIQAENDDGDMAEMRDGIFRGLNLGEEYRVAVCKAILVVCESVATGQEFIVLLTGLVAKCKPDLVIIDPLFAYCGCNVSDQERMSQFLRNGLNPILQANGCGLILVHHTNKPKTGREKPDWQAGDYAYLGSGTAELANWARAVVVIRSIGSHDVFQIVLPKRGKRAGLMDHKGEPRYSFHVKHGSPGICWELASEDDLTTQGKTPRPGKDDLLKLIPDDSSIGMAKLLNLAGDKGIGQNRCRNLLAELREDGRVFEWLTPRPGTNSAKSYSQRPQPECRP